MNEDTSKTKRSLSTPEQRTRWTHDYVVDGLSVKDIAIKYGKKERSIANYSVREKWMNKRKEYLLTTPESTRVLALKERNAQRASVLRRVGTKVEALIENMDLNPESEIIRGETLRQLKTSADILKIVYEGEMLQEGQPIVLRREYKESDSIPPKLFATMMFTENLKEKENDNIVDMDTLQNEENEEIQEEENEEEELLSQNIPTPPPPPIPQNDPNSPQISTTGSPVSLETEMIVKSLKGGNSAPGLGGFMNNPLSHTISDDHIT